MIRDRGRIKWTAMMLPEHVKILRDWAKEDSWETPKELDEQKLEEMNEIAQQALQQEKGIVVHYYIGKHYETAKGSIRNIDLFERAIRIIDWAGHIQSIPLEAIDDIQLLEE